MDCSESDLLCSLGVQSAALLGPSDCGHTAPNLQREAELAGTAEAQTRPGNAFKSKLGGELNSHSAQIRSNSSSLHRMVGPRKKVIIPTPGFSDQVDDHKCL